MHPCDPYREQLLESLYGLLEPSEEAALRTHRGACPACQACWQEAQSQQALLSRAALKCPAQQPFAPPLEVRETSEVFQASEVCPSSASVLPLATAPRRSRRRWAWVAAAAAVLVAVIGSAWWYQKERTDYRRQAIAATRKLEGIDAQVVALRQDYAKKENDLIRRLKEEFVQVSVTGPAVVQEGDQASYQITTKDADGKPRPAEVTVRNETRELKIKSDGEGIAQFPAGLVGRDGVASLEVAAETAEKKVTLSESIQVKPPACVTHLATNKSSYRVGEVLFFRTLTLERFSLKPPTEKIALRYRLLDSRGEAKIERKGYVGADGVGGGELALTDKLMDGDYTLDVAQTNGQRVQPVRRRLEIRRRAEPGVHFDRPHYRPGDYGTAFVPAAPSQPVVGAMRVDNKKMPLPGAPAGEAGGVRVQADKNGQAAFPFVLPPHVERDAALMLLEQKKVAGKDVAKTVKEIRIPVIPSRLAVDFYPEGGDLIEGIPTRVYYRVRTPQGESAAPEGHVILMSGKDVLLDSRNEAVGVFTMTPDASDDYTLRVTWPRQAQEKADWPSSNPFKGLIKKQGLAMAVPAPVGRADDPLDIHLSNTGPAKQLLVMANVRGSVVDQRFVAVDASTEGKPGAAKVRLRSSATAAGLIRITVYEATKSDLIPLAERLVYRAPTHTLTVSATTNRARRRPGERVTLDVQTRDENGAPAPATVLGLVVDQRAVPQAQPGLPAYFYLLAETGRDLDDADLIVSPPLSMATPFDLFSGAGMLGRALEAAYQAEAAHALDLYLGTNGWRRFVKRDSQDSSVLVQGKTGDDRKEGGEGRGMADADAPVVFHKESRQDYQIALERATQNLRQPVEQRLERLAAQGEESRRAAVATAVSLADFEERIQRALRLGLGILVLTLLGVGCLFLTLGMVRLARKQASPRPALGFALAAIFCALVLYGVVGRRLEFNDPGVEQELAQLAEHRHGTKLPEPRPALDGGRRAPDSLFFARADDPKQDEAKRNMSGPVSGYQARAESVNHALSSPAPPSESDGGGRGQLKLSDRLRDLFSENEESQLAAKTGATPEKGATDPATRLRENPAFARRFAHNANQHRGDAQDTVLWAPNLTVPPAGAASVSFGLSGTPATYQILLYANSPSGRLGFYRGVLQAR